MLTAQVDNNISIYLPLFRTLLSASQCPQMTWFGWNESTRQPGPGAEQHHGMVPWHTGLRQAWHRAPGTGTLHHVPGTSTLQGMYAAEVTSSECARSENRQNQSILINTLLCPQHLGPVSKLSKNPSRTTKRHLWMFQIQEYVFALALCAKMFKTILHCRGQS